MAYINPNAQPKNLGTPLFDPMRQQAFNQLLQQGLQNFNPQFVEQGAMKQFQTQIVPSLAERFTALGSGGSQRSSAFQGALGSAGSDLASQLAGLRGQYGLQQLQLGLTPQFQPQTSGPGFGSSIAGPLAQGVGSLGSIYALQGLLGGAGASAAAPGMTTAAAPTAAALGTGGTAASTGGGIGATLAGLSSQPWFWPLLAALAVPAVTYGGYKLADKYL